MEGDGFAAADRIRGCDLAFPGQVGIDDSLGDQPGHVRPRPIDLGGILARERTTPVRAEPAVRVNHELAPGQNGVFQQ